MSLEVELGTGSATAESYISVAFASAYHTARGNAEWNNIIELMTLDVAPAGAAWTKDDTITGATSGKTCVVVEMISSLTYLVKNRSGAFTLGEVLSNGTSSADQGVANPVFASSDLFREECLRKATEYMIQMYRDRWQGVRYTEDQALDWPRSGVVRDSWAVGYDEVPTEIKRACAELALKVMSAELAPDLTRGVVREKIGSMEVEYDKASPERTRYSAIEAMLKPFLKPGGGISMGLIRA
jgi:hypothetical protein